MPCAGFNGISLSHVDYERVKVKKLREIETGIERKFWGALNMQVQDGGSYVLSPHFNSSEGAAASGETVATFLWNYGDVIDLLLNS